jgi:malate synthase
MPHGVEVKGEITPSLAEILTADELGFVAKTRALSARGGRSIGAAQMRQAEFDGGKCVFDRNERHPRGDWICAPIPKDLQDRRVEITGPTDRKMVINALNSGAKMFMADFEDANSPTWQNMVDGQINLKDAIRLTISFRSPEGKEYQLNEQTAVLLVRPRGWHLHEKHLLVDGKPVSGGLFDFGLYFFHNARELLARGSGPYFYLEKETI